MELATIIKLLFFANKQLLLYLFVVNELFALKQMMNPKKVYTIDPGIASRIGFNFSEKKECDFVIKEGLNIVETIQVSYKIDQSNEQREYQGLLEAMSMFNLKQGLLLSYDTEKTINSDSGTIKVMPVWKWLMEGDSGTRVLRERAVILTGSPIL